MDKVKKRIRDTDLAKAEVALRRAADRAKKIAEETHTPLIVYEGGRIVKEFPGNKKVSESGKTF
ncbi:MAG: hypothetical protein HQK89_17500 [Nitrospirae bacterium]|nr:hypothetical protein [Nitrospirota bacterium]